MTDSLHAQIQFNEFGLPVATAFDDIYFTNENGLAESQYVFLQHNDLPERWQTHPQSTFVIAESGFGTGLNLLATWQLFLEHAPEHLSLHFISFEKFPLQHDDLRRALAAFPQLKTLADELIAAYPSAEPGCHRRILAQGRITLDIWVGDILTQLPLWLPHAQERVNAWYLDGFAPDKNPDMWQQPLYDAMASSAAAGCTFATFTAAGAVRRGLQQAGFAVTKVKGFGRKREMLRGTFPSNTPPEGPNHTTPITVVGGGIAAACTAVELQRAGYQVEVLTPGIADAASGNPQGAVYPLLHAQRSPLAEFFSVAFGYATHFYQQHTPAHWFPSGVVQLAYNEARQQRYQKVSAAVVDGGPGYDATTVQALDAAATQQLWPALPPYPSLYYPQGGWLRPGAVVQQLLHGVAQHSCAPLEAIEACPEGWLLRTEDGQAIRRERVVLACGAGLKQLLQPFSLALQNVRGQVTQVSASKTSATCPLVVCYKGYFTPVDQGQHCVGATYARDDEDLQARATDTAENLANLIDNLAPATWPTDLTACADRVALRNTTRDHLPIVGALANNLWVIGGLGSRGFTAAPLAASALVATLAQTPLPLSANLWQRLQPQRLQADD
ncbi:bifunctional tRNA (5-methylaminomethyl-2-thiouridine)(34)-methyltransferase MnmD/FAD-dependent 5-carboxymethylaminomethyl-2-thiouridine(34) oxidoreductase MnmC [Pseudidiomarina sediminum]|uniref:bifunctional tRNA (5-methylaminomethyl-2-thiouridine)(34)-methyltransferase MnmD/FAD-dependent 5-carboxymethylaminomethyl-2-thiouridine(34) oxidoreductase MnmC n=1 Tax=Pseudidiomarina sediminum TaxID=431675 RepID=UPI001C93CEA2|nr:bifunctional tRNA (5-methylaminomethyl-2-thiouridine)(34)-methyltransferase MnmD/FAD-dependent 5-carboxymethylaminomethyl-2-thiouridine(34) oxidoreductase MnmC [Pseudidiomarina sediminum]